jgi:hypothetical protein
MIILVLVEVELLRLIEQFTLKILYSYFTNGVELMEIEANIFYFYELIHYKMEYCIEMGYCLLSKKAHLSIV